MITKLSFILVALTIIGLISGLAIPHVLKDDDIYVGKVTFNTELDYTNFKEAVVDNDASWNNQYTYLDVLNSSVPIIVNFTLAVSQHNSFPYGKKQPNLKYVYSSFLLLGGILIILMVYLAIAAAKNYDILWLSTKK